MKVCSKCKRDKGEDEFHKSKSKKDGLQSYCKICLNDNAKRDYKENNRKELFTKRAKCKRNEVVELCNDIRAANGCSLCDEETVCCLDFHHLDPSKKDTNISFLAYAKSKDRMLAEMKKCVVLCSNCHRKVHAGLLEVNESHLCEITQ